MVLHAAGVSASAATDELETSLGSFFGSDERPLDSIFSGLNIYIYPPSVKKEKKGATSFRVIKHTKAHE